MIIETKVTVWNDILQGNIHRSKLADNWQDHLVPTFGAVCILHCTLVIGILQPGGPWRQATYPTPIWVVVTTDFKARVQVWGMPETDCRGEHVLNMEARLGLVMLNGSLTPSSVRWIDQQLILDIALASVSLCARVTNWSLLGGCHGRDHRCISFTNSPLP